VSVSFGTAFASSASGKMKELFAEADGEMYDKKLHRSKAAKEELARTLIARWRETTFRSAQEQDCTKRLAESFARHLNLGKESARTIANIAEYHDIGEIGIPSVLLGKKDALTPKEKIAIERHAEIGFRVAHASRDLLSASDFILKHHEWWNGSGYPLGIEGELIPFECRMMNVVIAYAAMTNDRPYRKAMGEPEAREELKKRAGTEFDPVLVESFMSMLDGLRTGSVNSDLVS
jgi:HD-GYP domain-containing protein (c-di-GMP phosphodiesterase class II)